jgi:hypothetical protein
VRRLDGALSMRGHPQRAAGWSQALLLVALVLLPTVARAHWHRDHTDARRPCATCVVAHHSPALSAPRLADVRPLFERRLLAPRSPLAPARHDRPMEAGRAPPLPVA